MSTFWLQSQNYVLHLNLSQSFTISSEFWSEGKKLYHKLLTIQSLFLLLPFLNATTPWSKTNHLHLHLGLPPHPHVEKRCQRIQRLLCDRSDIPRLHYYVRRTTENRWGRCRLNKGNFSALPPYGEPNVLGLFPLLFYPPWLFNLSENVGGIDSWAIKTFKKEIQTESGAGFILGFEWGRNFPLNGLFVLWIGHFMSPLGSFCWKMFEYQGEFELNWSCIHSHLCSIS